MQCAININQSTNRMQLDLNVTSVCGLIFFVYQNGYQSAVTCWLIELTKSYVTKPMINEILTVIFFVVTQKKILRSSIYQNLTTPRSFLSFSAKNTKLKMTLMCLFNFQVYWSNKEKNWNRSNLLIKKKTLLIIINIPLLRKSTSSKKR